MLRVRVLGALSLEVVGGPAPLPHGVARQLLAYLTLFPGRHARARVAGALWPDVPVDLALHRLRTTLWDLRRALPDVLPLLLEVDAHELGLRPEVDVDLREALGLLDAGASEAAFGLLAPGLTEEVGQEWAEPVRRDVEAWRLRAMERLVHEVDDVAVALAYAQQRLALTPLSEVAHADVMRLLLASGDRAGAMEAYERLRQMLERELAVGPSASSRELLVRIHDDEPCRVPVVRGPAATGARARPRLPVTTTPLIGREHDVADLDALVGAHRLVCLVGPAGVGKSRLATALAELQARRGVPVAFAELASTRRAEACDHVVAGALDVHAGPGRPIRDAILDRLALEPGVLVLDDCEHLVEHVRDLVTDVLRSNGTTTVLVTSRTPLMAPGEHVAVIAPLPVPLTDDGDLVLTSPAVQLLATAVRRRSPDVLRTDAGLIGLARIARQLDGLPLALELAGARIPTVGMTALADRLDRGLDILSTRLADPARPGALRGGRRDSLIGALDVSMTLLSPQERTLLGLVCALPGPFPLAAVEELASAAGLGADCVVGMSRLVEASLIQPHPGPPWSFSALRTIRTFGRTLIDDDTARVARDGLVRWAVQFAHDIKAREHSDEAAVHAEVTRFLPLVRAALDLARDRGDIPAQRQIITGVEGWSTWREQHEVWSWVTDLAAREPDGDADAEVLRMGALASRRLGRMDLMREFTARCVAADPDGPDGATAIEARMILALAERRWADAADLATVEQPQPARRVAAQVIAATSLTRLGRSRAALDAACTARREADRLSAPSLVAMAMLAEARARDAAQSTQGADTAGSDTAGMLADARVIADSVGLAELVAAIDRERGLRALRQGDPDGAVAPLTSACLHWLTAGNLLPVASTVRGLVAALSATGSADVADNLSAAAQNGGLTAARFAAVVRAAAPGGDDPRAVLLDR